MSEPIPQAEVQLCLSAKNHRKPAFTYAVLAEMQPDFEAEGNKDLCEGRLSEGSGVLAMVKAGRMSRHLYHARLNS